jgi:HEAT repeats
VEPQEIIRLLRVQLPDRRDVIERIASEAATSDLMAASHYDVPPLSREILFDLLGNKHDSAALPVLMEGLDDPSARVRSSAADALAKIRDPAAGPMVERRFEVEQDDRVRQMLALALGAIEYRPSIPLLIRALGQSTGTLSGAIAGPWALSKRRRPRMPCEWRFVVRRAHIPWSASARPCPPFTPRPDADQVRTSPISETRFHGPNEAPQYRASATAAR